MSIMLDGYSVLIVTGIPNLILNLACFNTLEYTGNKVLLLHMSNVCDEKYNKDFKEAANKLFNFDDVININYCIYETATLEGYNNGSLKEVTEELCLSRLKEIIGERNYISASIPHYFSPKMRCLIKFFKCDNIYSVEEGLNSYYRHYDKIDISDNDKICINSCKKIFFVEYMKLKHIFPYHKFGIDIQKINSQDIINNLNLIEFGNEISDLNKIDTTKSIVILGQYGLNDNNIRKLTDEYIEIIVKLIRVNNVSVVFIKHPRDKYIFKVLSKEFKNKQLIILDLCNKPVEALFNKFSFLAVVSDCSTASVSIPYYFGTPSFLISKSNNFLIGKGDLNNSLNYCKSVLPNINQLFLAIDQYQLNASNNLADIIKSIFNKKKSSFKKLQNLYLKERAKKYLKERAKKSTSTILVKTYDLYSSIPYINKVKESTSYFELVKNFIALIRINPIKLFDLKFITNNLKRVSKLNSSSPYTYKNTFKSIESCCIAKNYKRAYKILAIRILNRPLSFYGNFKLFYKIFRSYIINYNRNHISSIINFICFAINNKRLNLLMYLRRNANNSNLNQICCLTYRPNKGPFGGPGGVLYLESVVLGQNFLNKNLTFNFRTKENFYDSFFDLQSAIEFATHISDINNSGLYIAHDLGTAYALAKLNKKFIVFWHFQGSLITQQINFGFDLPKWVISFIKHMEAFTLSKSFKIVFPSIGALEMYKNDSYSSFDDKYLNKTKVIYNTCIFDYKDVTLNNEFIDYVSNFKGLKLISCGTLTKAKGQDIVIDLLSSLNIEEQILWICIGNGILSEELLEKTQVLNKNITVKFIYKTDHQNVQALMKMCDIYIMCHRISIFDIASLEAMMNNCALILSRIGGNIDFNKDDNVIFTDEKEKISKLLQDKNYLQKMKIKSTDVFYKFFSVNNFYKNHEELINE